MSSGVQMEHPTVVRNFLNVHNASRVNTSNVDNEPITARRSSRQMLETGRTDSGSTSGNAVLKGTTTADPGSTSYDEAACQAVGQLPHSIADRPLIDVCVSVHRQGISQ
jgi:hypothetical protein